MNLWGSSYEIKGSCRDQRTDVNHKVHDCEVQRVIEIWETVKPEAALLSVIKKYRDHGKCCKTVGFLGIDGGKNSETQHAQVLFLTEVVHERDHKDCQ